MDLFLARKLAGPWSCAVANAMWCLIKHIQFYHNLTESNCDTFTNGTEWIIQLATVPHGRNWAKCHQLIQRTQTSLYE
jgi:hypothetical protein